MKNNQLYYLILILLSLTFGFPVGAKEKILIVSKDKSEFKQLADSLEKDLSAKYTIQVMNLNKNSQYADFETQVKAAKPNLAILMDNQAVTFAKEFYQKNKNESFQSVAVMGLNYKNILKGEKNICGIAYEVPAFTLLTQFRFAKSDKKLKKVITFYRGSQFSEMVEESIALTKTEGIELVGIDVEKTGQTPPEYLKTKGKAEIVNGKFDAVYVLLDSALLEKKIFSEFWLPVSSELKVPFVVGTEKLVSTSMDFAVYGMSPSISDLSSQTLQMVESLMSKEKCSSIGVEDLIGVIRFWNEKKAKKLSLN